MARTKQKARRSKHRTDQNCSKNDKAGTVSKSLHGGVISLKQPLLKWDVNSFLDHLYGEACFSTLIDLTCLFNKEEVKREILKQQSLSFPSHELPKLENLKSLPSATSFSFVWEGRFYYSKRSVFDGGVVIQATGSSEDVANEASAALIISNVFGEGKLARYLFEHFLTKRSTLNAPEACLYWSPDADNQLPDGNPQPPPPKPQKIKNRKRDDDHLELTDFPCRLSMDEFFSSLPERKLDFLTEKPKEIAQTMKLPTEVVFALRDLNLFKGQIEQNRHAFKNKSFILECRFIIQNPNSGLASCSYEAFARSRPLAREACCALVLAHYFGDPATARQLLENFMKISPVEVVLYHKPGSGPKSTLQISDVLKPFSEKLACLPNERKISVYKAFDLRAPQDVSREGQEVPDAYQSCYSPLQAFKVKRGPAFSFGEFVILPIFRKPDYDQMYCCLIDEGGELFGDIVFCSNSLYVSLQICCARFLKDENESYMVRDSVTRKFDRLYRKDYECYEIVTLVNIPPKKELLDLAKSASSWILEKVIQEDEEFERAVKDKTLLRDGPVDSDQCKYMYEKLKLFTSFLSDETLLAPTNRKSKLGHQIFCGKRRVNKTVDLGTSVGVDAFLQSFQHEDMEIVVSFYQNHFVACLFISNCGQFVAKSEASAEDALKRAVQVALQLRDGVTCQKKNAFGDIDFCDLVNMAEEKLGLDLWQLTECIVPESDLSSGRKVFMGKLTINDKVWSSKPCRNEVTALRELLISVFST